MERAPPSLRLGIVGWWGLAGVLALLGQAIARLVPLAWEALTGPLSTLELVVLVGWVAFIAYAEGYRGFQRQFSPRVVVRARHLRAHARPLFVALAPLYCIGLVHATRKRLITSWTITLAIVAVVVLVRHVEQPWRGIIDAGVVVGLAWGALAILVFALARRELATPPDLPA